jgi:hypothetical protein
LVRDIDTVEDGLAASAPAVIEAVNESYDDSVMRPR